VAEFQLARAYAVQNESTKPKTANQNFRTLWKDADLDVPIP
jgi:hypothetical protein